MFFRKKKRILQPYVLDIGTREVKVLSFDIDFATQNVTLQSYGSSSLPVGSIVHGCIENLPQITNSVQNALIQAQPASLPKKYQPSIIIGTSGIMVDIECSHMEYERDNPNKKINSSEWSETLKRVGARIAEEEYQSEKYYNMPMGLTQSSIERIALDGEATNSVIKQKASRIEFDLFNSYIPETHLSNIITLTDSLQLLPKGVFHSLYGVAKLIIDNHIGNTVNMVLIDIGDSHTDVAMIVNGQVKDVKSFSIGGAVYTQRIAQTFNLSFDEAESLKKEYSMAQLPKNISKKIADILTPDIKMWLQGVEVTIGEMTQMSPLPERVIIFGGGSLLIGIKEALEYGSWYKHITKSYKPLVSLFYPKNLSHIVDETDTIVGPQHIPLLGLLHLASRMEQDYSFGNSKK